MFYEIVLRVFWIFAFIIMYPILLVTYALEDAWTYINHKAQASERARARKRGQALLNKAHSEESKP